jgi:menaquinone-9 beta-reductase
MITRDVIIVGGGPGGSSAAWELRKQGIDCLVLDRTGFPRLKLCGGWITPQVLHDLQLAAADYPHSLVSFDTLKIHLRGVNFSMPTLQHSIRRIEFDHWLLQRSGAEVSQHEVKNIRRENGVYILDDRFRCNYLIGAGGTRCPVYRTFFRERHPRPKHLQVVAQEQEFAYDWRDRHCHLWFFDGGLPGYAWYVPKGNGYLNVGIGGMAAKLKRRQDGIKPHWQRFTQRLRQSGLVGSADWNAGGYSYYLRDGVDVIRIDNTLLVGDAAGLATRDMCEGIGPAIRSGILAAKAVASGGSYSLDTVSPYTIGRRLVNRTLDYLYSH